MTQVIVGLNAALIVGLGALPQTNLEDDIKTIVAIFMGMAIAFIGPFLPKVSETIRAAMDLRAYNRK